MQRQKIVGLQYLRGLAALAVVLDHVVVNAAFPKYFGPDPAWMFFHHGWRGVDLFFVISGFVITIVSLDGAALRPAMGLRTFFARRFARIVPLMWLSILSYIALQLLFRGGALAPLPYVHALLLLPGEVLPPYIWTLRQELIFYALFAMAMLTVRPARILLPLWFAACLAQTFDLFGFGSVMGGLRGIILYPRNLYFGMGMLIAIFWLRRPMPRQWRTPVAPPILLAVMFVAAVAALTLGRAMLGGWSIILGVVLLGAIVACGVIVACPAGPLRRAGELLGAASYSIYLFHAHAVSGALGILARSAPGMARGGVVLLVTALAVIAGIVVHLLVERPIVRLAQRRLAADPKPSKAMPSAVDP